MENLYLVLTAITAVASLVISLWNKYTSDKNNRIARTTATINEVTKEISDNSFLLLKDDFETKIEEGMRLSCMEKKLEETQTNEYIKAKMERFRKQVPEVQEELVTNVLQLYRTIKFFLDEDQIDSKMLAIVLQSDIESHLEILDKGMFSGKVSFKKTEKQDLVAYLEDVSSVLDSVLGLKFYTPVKESKIQGYKANIQKYLNT